MHKDPLDATLFANRSLCWLRLGNGEEALLDAKRCKMMSPSWSKAWYREGAALRLLKVYSTEQLLAPNFALSNFKSNIHLYAISLYVQNYKGAANAFVEALKLDPANDEIKTALRQFSCLFD